ncbi:MAG TPA: hypothetical protein ENJ56_02275, partial [Anaerolineae bacterium]|nr:hypothetical protein [Anaerolineae bacterium]
LFRSFYGDSIIAVQADDEAIYVPLRPICETLGVAWTGQARKLRNDPVLSDVAASVNISVQVVDGRGHITSRMLCLPLDYLNGWLFGINANRVKDSVREVLLRYQRDCFKVLADVFGRKQITALPDAEIETSSSPSAIAYRNALQLANLARQQFMLEKRIESVEEIANNNTSRLGLIEAKLGDPKAHITLEQATHIAEAVKTMAHELGKRSGRNEYQSIYGELYRRFKIPSYRELPATRFDEAMSWLRSWYESLFGDVPF